MESAKPNSTTRVFSRWPEHESRRISGSCGQRWSPNASTATVLGVLVFAIDLWSVAVLDVQARADVPDSPPYEPEFSDRAAFAEAIGKAEKYDLERQKLTGITLPHHLLAAPLIAAGLSIVDPGTVKHVLILLPDHHAVLNGSFGTTRTGFKTVFGLVNVSASKTNALLQHRQDFEETDLFAHEHAIGALLPFVKNYLPTADIVPIAISPRSRRDDWDVLVTMLAPLIDSDTLVIQSSDFSHYLAPQRAARRDQETLNILAAHDYAQTASLSQPSNINSAGAQYVQERLQKLLFDADPNVIFNMNSQQFLPSSVPRTTSYVVEIYQRPNDVKIAIGTPGSRVLLLRRRHLFWTRTSQYSRRSCRPKIAK